MPATVDACYSHDGEGVCEGIKTQSGGWNLAGHRDRIVPITDAELDGFARIFDPPHTKGREARLPGIHSRALVTVLNKFVSGEKTLGGLGPTEVFINSTHWNEKNAQDDGTIRRRSDADNGFAAVTTDLILSGPHFGVANPCSQTPRRICRTHRAYEALDLQHLPDSYLPRGNYQRACDPDTYRARLPRVSWRDADQALARPSADFYRVVGRRGLSLAGERTLLAAVIPPGVAHIDAVISVAFRRQELVPIVAGCWASVPFDFYIKSIGKGDFRNSSAETMPLPKLGEYESALAVRALALNCLTVHNTVLWNDEFDPSFTDQSWSKSRTLGYRKDSSQV